MSALASPVLTGTVAAAIADEEVLQPNRLAWVTPHFLIIRNQIRQNHTIIPVSRVCGIRVVKTPYAGFLAIAAGVFVIAAAAFASKEGDGAAIPSALLGAFLMAAYYGSRRANITFVLDSGGTETTTGNLREATNLIRLIEQARRTNAELEDVVDLSTAPCASPSLAKKPKARQPVFEPFGFA
jgi:hypothetical protein